MKKTILSVLTVAFLSSFALFGCGDSEIKFGTAAKNSKYDEFAGVMKSNLEREGKYRITIVNSAGSAANVRNLNTGDIQMALAQNDVSSDAYHAVGAFKGGFPLHDFAAVASIYTESCHVVVRADSSIYKMTDLVGKKVSIGELHSGSEQNAKQILNAYDVIGYQVQSLNYNYDEATKNLINGSIDAMFFTGGVRMPVLVQLSKQVPIRLVPIDEEQIKKVMDNYKFYTKMVIPAGSYVGQNEPVTTLGIKTLLVASRTMDPEDVEEITENLFKNANSFTPILPGGDVISLENAVEGVSIPFHRGAARYYHSKNIKVKTD